MTDFSKLRAAMHNLGCKVNSYEAESMLNELREAGAEIVPWDTEADIYIINTCSVTNIADRKSRQMLHRARAQNPDAIVVGTGCYVQARAEELRKDLSVDILIGNNRKSRIVPAIRDFLQAREAARASGEGEDNACGGRTADSLVPVIREEKEYEEMARGAVSEKVRAFLKIQDGCSQFCSYCIIPLVRGRIRSRREEDALAEIRQLAGMGYHEIVLTGIHLSSYGMDFEAQSYEYAMNREIPSDHLLGLIEAAAQTTGITRIRLGSLEPRIITEQFVRRLRAIPEICPHFHLSLQSGCDRTLRAMNRHYDTAAFRESVRLIRAAWPDAAITTDVIVGFPGETEEDFRESFRFIEETGFYELHVFKYSRRQGTAADRMPGQLTDREKTRRSAELLRLDERASAAFRERFLFREDTILPEEVLTEGGQQYLCGFNREYVKFYVPVEDPASSVSKIGEEMRVRAVKNCATYLLASACEIV